MGDKTPDEVQKLADQMVDAWLDDGDLEGVRSLARRIARDAASIGARTALEELPDAEAVNSLAADSVIADADGYVFQVEDQLIEGDVCIRGIEGMGFGSSGISMRYPVTVLRHGGGGRMGISAKPPKTAATHTTDEETTREDA